MLEAYIDGACEPKNPGGTASWGYLILGSGSTPVQDWGIVGSGPKMSNNVAEYSALIELLKWLDQNLLPSKEVVVYSDSQMLVNQMNGEWSARPDKLYYSYYQQALRLYTIDQFRKQVKFKWIPREQNLADELSVKALAEVGIVRRSR